MSTVKITQLTESVSLNANTANTILIGVDLPTLTTVKFSLETLISRVLSATAVDSYANSAYNKANSVFSQANAAFLQANSAYASQNVTGTYANSAYAKANSALANTTGTFSGNLTVSGNVTVLGQTSSIGPVNTGNLIVFGTSTLTGNVVMNAATYMTGAVTVNSTMVLSNSNFNTTEAAMTIKATATVQTPSQSGTMLHISGKANTPSRIIFDSFSTDGSAYGIVAGRTARGTVASPTATQNNDVLMRFAGNGWGTTGFAPLGVARIDIVATENYSDTNRGSKIVFYNVPNGSNTVNEIASFNADHVDFTGVVSPSKGFIYTPRILTGAQTAITINFATDSMVRATFSSTLTMSFSNYTYGKVVEAWLTNTAGTGQTINLGVQANNSTTGATTLTVASQRSAKLQYFSIDGDLANTFVAISYN